MWGIQKPDGTLIDYVIGPTQMDVWFDFGWNIACEAFGDQWRSKYWKRAEAALADFKRRGYKLVKVKIVKSRL